MKLTTLAATLAALTLLLAGIACGGDDDDKDGGGQVSEQSGDDGSSGEIRVSKGLTVAAINAGLGSANGADADAEIAEDTAAAIPQLGDPGTRSSAGAAPAADSAFALRDSYGTDSSVRAQSTGGAGITVSGYGTASAAADSAVIELYFGPGGGGGIREGGGTIEPITEEQLQPVIDALVGAGVAREDIEFVSQGYYDPYYSSGTLRARVRDINIVQTAAQAATDASAALSSISLQSTNITFTLTDCAAMERASLEAAAEDAADNGALLAEVLGVGIGGITGADNYSYPYYYYGYGGAIDENTCASSNYGAVPFYTGQSISTDQTVEVYGNVTITYAIS